ncbi:MAG: LPS assembly lipoprotein LptE [Pseudomonadota bacterium]
MWWRNAPVLALVLLLAACQVRPVYYSATGPDGQTLSPTTDLRAIIIDVPANEPRRFEENRTAQVLRNELLFLFRGDGGPSDQQLYRLRLISSLSTDPLAVELEEDLPSAIMLTMTGTFILSELGTERTLLTGSATTTASYDFSSQRFANVRAERDAGTRAARSMAQNIGTRIAAYFAARRDS